MIRISGISYWEWINVISLRNMALALTFIELDLRSTSSVDNLAQLQFIVVETKNSKILLRIARRILPT